MSVTNEQGLYEKPLANWPGHIRCRDCEHPGSKHRFMYGVPSKKYGQLDRYRCEAKLPNGNTCNCGEEYTPKVFMVPRSLQYLTESDSGRRQLIDMISAGEIPEVYKPK